MRGGGAAAAGGRAEGEVRRMAGGLATFFFAIAGNFSSWSGVRSFGELHLASILLGVKLRLAAAVYPIN